MEMIETINVWLENFVPSFDAKLFYMTFTAWQSAHRSSSLFEMVQPFTKKYSDRKGLAW